MKSFIQKAKLERNFKYPMSERDFLVLYSLWHETRDLSLKNRLFMSFGALLKSEPEFDFRKKLWQAV